MSSILIQDFSFLGPESFSGQAGTPGYSEKDIQRNIFGAGYSPGAQYIQRRTTRGVAQTQKYNRVLRLVSAFCKPFVFPYGPYVTSKKITDRVSRGWNNRRVKREQDRVVAYR